MCHSIMTTRTFVRCDSCATGRCRVAELVAHLPAFDGSVAQGLQQSSSNCSCPYTYTYCSLSATDVTQWPCVLVRTCNQHKLSHSMRGSHMWPFLWPRKLTDRVGTNNASRQVLLHRLQQTPKTGSKKWVLTLVLQVEPCMFGGQQMNVVAEDK